MSAPGVLRVALFGTESTGKSSLAETLAAHFDEPWSPEYVRTYWDEHDGKIGAENLDAIARGQLAGEDAAAARAKRVVFHDTELLTNVLWADLLFPGACPGWIRSVAETRSRSMAHYLLCAPDIPWITDPQRVFTDDAARAASALRWRETLVSRGLPFVEITGDWAQREALAVTAVEKLLADKTSSRG
jgi:HTH-type transcriptional regulator, transcriptional repressor of NAD biosynthesis genes